VICTYVTVTFAVISSDMWSTKYKYITNYVARSGSRGSIEPPSVIVYFSREVLRVAKFIVWRFSECIYDLHSIIKYIYAVMCLYLLMVDVIQVIK